MLAADLVLVVTAPKVATFLVTVETAVLVVQALAVGLLMTLEAQQGSESWLQAADILQVAVEVEVPSAFNLVTSIRSPKIRFMDLELLEVRAVEALAVTLALAKWPRQV